MALVDVVETIERQVDPVEYIGRVSPLQKIRTQLQRPLPLPHREDPLVLRVPRPGTWRCFGTCGEGDIFTFVQKRENTDFRGALRVLAAEAGVELVAEDPRKRSHNERLAATMSAAVDTSSGACASRAASRPCVT